MRIVLHTVLCFLLGRVSIMGISPVAVATLLVLQSDRKKNRSIPIMAVILGLITALMPVIGSNRGGDIVKYLLIWTCIVTVDKLAVKCGVNVTRQVLFWLGGCITLLIDIGGGILDIQTAIMLALLEAALVVVLANLMYRGIGLFDYIGPGYEFGNEEMISFIICIIAVISGIPEPATQYLSISGIMYNLFILYMGYRHGIAAGAMTGASVGIVSGIAMNNASVSGVYCIVGICVGMMKSLGRIAGAIGFLSVFLAAGIIYPDLLWNVRQFSNVLLASCVFVVLPYRLFDIKRADDSADNEVMRYNYQYETSRKLGEFSQALFAVSDCFRKQVKIIPVMNGSSAREIFTELTNTVCGGCTNCNYCWGQNYNETYRNALSMIESAENIGTILKENVSDRFVSGCIHFDELMYETNRQLDIARLDAWWNNRQAQTRMLIAEQMSEVARLIARLEKDVLESDRVHTESETEIKQRLKNIGVKVTNLQLYEKRSGITEIYMKARADRGCVLLKDIVAVISEVMNIPYRSREDMPVSLGIDYEMLGFVREERYKVLTGTARIAKDGEELSGDNYSFIKMRGGKLLMTITDGMGTGRNAFHESSVVIEMIEQLVEAGFGEDMALRFVNSTMICSGREDMFSTVDMCVIDLNIGMCECIKCGAAATFIKKKNEVKIISNDAMPIGIIPEMSYARTCYRLSEGDYVIMVSDGITDSLPCDDKEYVLSKIIEEADCSNSTEFAEYILHSARQSNMCRAVDDMSVIVAGLWYRY